MTFTKIAIAAGVVLLGFLCFLASIGLSIVTEGLVTLLVLAVIIAGGNLLGGRAAYGHRLPEARVDAEPAGEEDGAPATPSTRAGRDAHS